MQTRVQACDHRVIYNPGNRHWSRVTWTMYMVCDLVFVSAEVQTLPHKVDKCENVWCVRENSIRHEETVLQRDIQACMSLRVEERALQPKHGEWLEENGIEGMKLKLEVHLLVGGSESCYIYSSVCDLCLSGKRNTSCAKGMQRCLWRGGWWELGGQKSVSKG